MENKIWVNEPVFSGENVSVITYCQNPYQEKRVGDFLQRSKANVIWMNERNYSSIPYKTCTFYRNGAKRGCSSFSLNSKVGCIKAPAKKEVYNFMSQSDKILVILSKGAFCQSLDISSLRVIESLEKIALSVNKHNKIPIEYFRIVHSGNYMGRVYSAKREDFK